METYKYLSKLWSPSTSSSASSSPEVAARTLPTPPPTPPPSTAAQLHEDDHAGDGEHRTDDRDASGASTSQSMATSGRVVDPDSGIEGDLLDVKTPPQPGDTLYLSARRRPRTLANQDGIGGAGTEGDLGPDDGRPQITISQGVPPHLEGAVRAELQRRASQGKGRATPPSDPGQDAGDGSETELQTDTDPVSVMRPANDAQQDELDGTNSSDNDKIVPRDESDAEPERLLAIKQRTHHQRQLRRRYQLSRSWPVRLSVSFYVLIRHLLSWVGIPYSPRSPHNALLAPPPYTELKSEAYARNNTLDNDQTSPDELLASLEKSQQQHQPPDQPSTPTRSSLFPWGTANPPSQTPSPALRPTPKPPRLTPKVLVLDLDETLIHSTSRPYASSKKNQGLKVRVVEVVLDGRSTVYTVYKRPWVDFFLRKVSRPGRMCAPGIRTSRS